MRLAGPFFWMTGVAACVGPTQLVVVVDTDMGATELHGFRVHVRDDRLRRACVWAIVPPEP